jgi:L-lactate dehydrogenase complex protein LldG
MSRDFILHRVRTSLGRSAGEAPGELPPVRLSVPVKSVEERVEEFARAFTALAGTPYVAQSCDEACRHVGSLIAGKSAVASNSPWLRECGITALPEVTTGVTDRDQLRELCARADFGITSADYALSDTGTLVMIASPAEQRLVSLLPPVHIAVVPRERILGSLDELFDTLPDPAAQTSSMVLITGPSRTADIEQILIRGVHGPGEIHAVIV